MTDDNLKQRLEEAALNAWPALQHILYDGWILRFSGGYTRRANSVNALYPSHLPLDEKVAFCERQYQARNLPPVFRLTDFSTPAELDTYLAGRGYQAMDTTYVMQRSLENYAPIASPAIEFHNVQMDEWLAVFSSFTQATPARQQAHRLILQSIAATPLWVVVAADGLAKACGLGVLEGDFFGLFDLVTHADQRRQGFGTALVNEMLQWAKAQGARQAYLQVMGNNEPARLLYAKLGFQDLYAYWYRMHPMPVEATKDNPDGLV